MTPTAAFEQLHVGWMSLYTLILIALLIAEMYAVGTGKGYALTTNTIALCQRAPWMTVPIMLFLIWLPLHFGFRLIPILFSKQPIYWF